MVLPGSAIILPPPDGVLFTGAAALLFLLAAAGLALRRGGGGAVDRRWTRGLVLLGAAGFLASLGWGAWIAVENHDWYLKGRPAGLHTWLLYLDRPLHVVAAGTGWLLLAGAAAGILSLRGRVRPWIPPAALALLAVGAWLPATGEHDRDGMGLRDFSQDRLDREARGIYEATSADHLHEGRVERLPAARWLNAALLLFEGLAGAAVVALVLERRRRPLGALSLPMSALALNAAVLWGLCSFLAVAQAVSWSSPRTPPGDVEAAALRALAPPFLCAWAAAALAAISWRRRREDGPVGEGGR